MQPNVSPSIVEQLTERTKLFCQDIITIVQKVEIQTRLESEGDKMPANPQDSDDFDGKLMWKMLDAAPVLVVELFDGVTDPLILKATKTVEKMFGYFSGELIDQPISVLIPPDKRAVHGKHIAELLTNLSERQMGASTNVEPEGINKLGERFPIELSWAVEVIHRRRFLIATVMRQLRGK